MCIRDSFNSVDEYYKDNTAVMDIVFVNGDTDKRTSQTIDEIKDILGDKGHYVGMAVQNKSLQENVSSEMKPVSYTHLDVYKRQRQHILDSTVV